MYGLILLLPILGATIWTGGHIVLAVTVLPGVLLSILFVVAGLSFRTGWFY
ncbi:MAG: hypothetical protein WC997_01565 [Porticoccaceae bacterium]